MCAACVSSGVQRGAVRGAGSGLVSFLRRHPFSSRAFLGRVFGERTAEVLLRREAAGLRRVEVPGVGACYADKREPEATLLGLQRFEMVRRFALDVMGPDGVRAGLSPGFHADGDFFWQDRWWRLWVDPGGCAPEGLPFVHRPPQAFGDGVRDVVLTANPDRLELVVSQVEFSWGGGGEVHIWLAGTDVYRVARPGGRWARRKWAPYTRRDLEVLLRRRMRGSRRRSWLGKLARDLSAEDWGLLVEVGNHPLFTVFELAYLITDESRGFRSALGRLGALEARGLIETARSPIARDQLEDRKALTWRGLTLLAGRWGTTPEAMRVRHPWPQRRDAKGRGHIEYSLRWLYRLGVHQRLVRQFTLSVLHGARCVTNSAGGVAVEAVTTIGSRILYRDLDAPPGARARLVVPDARLGVEFWRRARLGGAPGVPRAAGRSSLLVEVDRATIPLSRLAERLDRYAEVWASLADQRPTLVWVIEGSPYRESEILGGMRARGLEGWTVTLERLSLPPDDRWWLVNPPASLSKRGIRIGLPYASTGGMAPWRRVWMGTGRAGYRPFLGCEPWVSAGRARPRRGQARPGWTGRPGRAPERSSLGA